MNLSILSRVQTERVKVFTAELRIDGLQYFRGYCQVSEISSLTTDITSEIDSTKVISGTVKSWFHCLNILCTHVHLRKGHGPMRSVKEVSVWKWEDGCCSLECSKRFQCQQYYGFSVDENLRSFNFNNNSFVTAFKLKKIHIS